MVAQFLEDVTLGVEVFAAVALAGGVLSALLAGERSNLDDPKVPFRPRELLGMVMFPTHGARDFYKTLAARFLLTVGSGIVSNYMLYILQDYLRLDQTGSQRMLSVTSAITLAVGLVCCLVAGPIADRIGRPKLLTVVTACMMAVGALVPFLVPTPGGLVAFSAIVGVANGASSSLIQTISVEVLPDPAAAAKDLGFLNLANTLGGVGGSFAGAAVIGVVGYGGAFVGQAVAVLAAAALFASIRRVR
ncbi:MFS transporter [Bifidobacterium pullorum subsp. saeculare]|uniref:MFS transporter n=1 Tax=Bifidobacterium pullorum subsp. saeculare TaxID=78257 RepID=A0A939B8K1_9BIFI|nr:MFS transporter [Bifidobacterium pullorum]MBM6699977.1 MFS transporter [Bifidobacterium pullorum subsp. saeculare]